MEMAVDRKKFGLWLKTIPLHSIEHFFNERCILARETVIPSKFDSRKCSELWMAGFLAIEMRNTRWCSDGWKDEGRILTPKNVEQIKNMRKERRITTRIEIATLVQNSTRFRRKTKTNLKSKSKLTTKDNEGKRNRFSEFSLLSEINCAILGLPFVPDRDLAANTLYCLNILPFILQYLSLPLIPLPILSCHRRRSPFFWMYPPMTDHDHSRRSSTTLQLLSEILWRWLVRSVSLDSALRPSFSLSRVSVYIDSPQWLRAWPAPTAERHNSSPAYLN